MAVISPWTGAGDAVAQQVRQRIVDQLTFAQKQQDMDLAQRSADRADAQQRLMEQQRADTLAERTSNNQATQTDRVFKENEALNESVPPNTFIAPESPLVGRLRQMGSLQPQEERPAVETGPLQPGDTGGAKMRGFLKMATAKQQDTQTDNERQAARDKQLAGDSEWRLNLQQQLADLKSGQAPTSNYQLQPEIDPVTGKQTGRFLGYNTKANRWEPVGGQGPEATKPAPGAAQAAQADAAKKDALGSLNQLDTAIDDAKDLVGPGAGRVSKLEQLIGNPDPRISALGTKLLLTKMQVDHAASGSVRAGASPALLARWDNLLSQNLTPENLKAAVKAMREILGGGTATAGPAATPAGKPTAADLIRKYGG